MCADLGLDGASGRLQQSGPFLLMHDEAREIRRRADVEFLTGLDKVANDASNPIAMRQGAAILAARFRLHWIDAGRSGDPMTSDQRFFHTV